MRKFTINNEKLFPALAAFISGAAISIYFDLLMRDAWILIFFAALYFIYKTCFRLKDVVILRTSRICGVIFALAMSLARLETISYHKFGLLWFAVMFVGLYFVMKNVLAMIYIRALHVSLQREDEADKNKTSGKLAGVFFGALIFILLCYLPAYMHCFPGLLNSDSFWQLQQAAGISPLSTHSPLLHTLIIKLMYDIGMKMFDGNQTYALGLYSAFQCIALAASFAYTVETMYKLGVKRWVIILITAVYALSPYHDEYSVTMWKDVWFGGAMLALLTTVWRMIRHYENGERLRSHEMVLLFIFTLLTCLFRNAAVYAIAVFAVFLLVVFAGKREKAGRMLKVPLTVIAAVLVAFCIEGPIYSSFNIGNFGISESLSIPIQQVARTISDGGELTGEQEELLSRVVDIDKIPETYKPQISDDMKRLIHSEEIIENNKLEYIKLWLSLGMKYPKSYLNAWIAQTIGYWYPPVFYYVTLPEQNVNLDFDIQYGSLLPEKLDRLYVYTNSISENLPYVGLLYSVGLSTWLCIFMLGMCSIRGKRREKLLFVPILVVIVGLLAGTPVFAEFRYVYTTITALPLLCVVPFTAGKTVQACRTENTNGENAAD